MVSKLKNQKQILMLAVYTLLFVFTAFRAGRIENLYPGFMQKEFTQTPNIPVIVEYKPDGYASSYLEFIACLSDEQQYEFVQSTPKLMEKLNQYDELFLLIENEMDDVLIPENYTVKKKFDCGYGLYNGYNIIKKQCVE
jgi:hypothetical protein